MSTENNPLFQSLKNAVNYCQNTPVLDACVEILESLVEHYEYTGHPDDENQYDSAMRGDLEAYYFTCMDIQERCEGLMDFCNSTTEWDERHYQAHAEYHELWEKYGSKSE